MKPLKGNRLKLAVRRRQSAARPEARVHAQRKRRVHGMEGAGGALTCGAGQHELRGPETGTRKVTTHGWCYSRGSLWPVRLRILQRVPVGWLSLAGAVGCGCGLHVVRGGGLAVRCGAAQTR